MLPTRDYLNIPEQLSLHFPRKWRIGEGSTSFKSSMSETCPVILNALPASSNPPALSCAKSHQNSTPVQLCATCLCLPKSKAKEHGHCQKRMPRLLTTIWQRKAVWKTLFQNKPSRTINPVYLPQTTLEQYKESANKTLSITNLAQYFYPATLEEHPINNYDPDRVLFWKKCTGKKCSNSYTLDLG